jgi:hypothetical protein
MNFFEASHVHFDASVDVVAYLDENDQEDLSIVIFRTWGTQKGAVAHAIDFSAHKLRWVVTSTKAAETQAALGSLE